MSHYKIINGKEYLVITPGYLSIDASIADEFKIKLNNIIEEENYFILIDLINVIYIDSIGLSALISVLKYLKSKGDIALININETINLYFKLTRMDRVFTLCEFNS